MKSANMLSVKENSVVVVFKGQPNIGNSRFY